MIDFHTHILPFMDDGSKSIEESLAMLEMLKKQGVKTVIATPHFCADDETVDSFIERRDRSVALLKQQHTDEPEIIPAAEVRYYNGISRHSGFEKLFIKDSHMILLEMPFRKWTEYDIREIEDIVSSGRATVVLAHIERYMSFQKKAVFDRFLHSGVLFQSNASFFTTRFQKTRAINMMRRNKIHFLGSDCHNLGNRAPDIDKAVSALEKKLGNGFVTDYVNYGNDLFLQNRKIKTTE